jgi:multidrug efflux pump subunit AcrA (membrane-fusion protein)
MINIRWRRWVIPVILFGVLGLSFTGCRSRGADQVTVTTASARIGQVTETVTISGILMPNQSLKIFSKVAGLAQYVGAEVGDRVSAGQLLVQIDTKELHAQLQQAQAAVQAVRDQAEQAQIGISTARSNLDLAQKSYDRIKTLFDSGAASQSQLDDAQNQLEQAKNAYAAANKQYQAATGSGLAQAEAAVNLLQVQIGNGTIVSPINGIVSSRNIDPGGMASPAAPLMTVDDDSTLKLQGSVSQDVVPLLAIGQKAPVAVDALPGKSFEGTITQIGPEALATGQYPVVISVKNPGTLLAGMTARAALNVTTPPGVVVPASAVQSEGGYNYVFIVKDGVVSRRQVTPGLGNATVVLAASGVSPGEEIAASNVSALHDGMAVIKDGTAKF